MVTFTFIVGIVVGAIAWEIIEDAIIMNHKGIRDRVIQMLQSRG
jgi:hypothetical protein